MVKVAVQAVYRHKPACICGIKNGLHWVIRLFILHWMKTHTKKSAFSKKITEKKKDTPKKTSTSLFDDDDDVFIKYARANAQTRRSWRHFRVCRLPREEDIIFSSSSSSRASSVPFISDDFADETNLTLPHKEREVGTDHHIYDDDATRSREGYN